MVFNKSLNIELLTTMVNPWGSLRIHFPPMLTLAKMFLRFELRFCWSLLCWEGVVLASCIMSFRFILSWIVVWHGASLIRNLKNNLMTGSSLLNKQCHFNFPYYQSRKNQTLVIRFKILKLWSLIPASLDCWKKNFNCNLTYRSKAK